MNIIKAVLSWIGMTISGMWGGQQDKAVRRFGLPAIAMGAGFSFGWKWKYLAFLLFIPVLIMGYGVDSVLGGFLGHVEWLIRLIYSLLLSVPFIVFGAWRYILASVLLVVAFQIHAGSFGQIFGKDILIEDFIRYGTLAGLVLFNIMTNKD